MSYDNSYNLNRLWSSFSVNGNETLSLSVFQSNASVVMFKKGSDSRRPVVKMNLSLAACIKIADILRSLLDSQPETRMPFVQMRFNRDTRSYEQETSFVFFKDEKKCYGIEISSKLLPAPAKIMFKCSSTFSTGSETMTDEQKSVLGVREFIMILTNQIPTAMLLSRWNMEQSTRPSGNVRGNQPRKSSDPYGGTSSASAPRSMPAEENVFG